MYAGEGDPSSPSTSNRNVQKVNSINVDATVHFSSKSHSIIEMSYSRMNSEWSDVHGSN